MINHNLTIIDWDNTLFPTTYYLNNLHNNNAKYFSNIDKIISSIFEIITRKSKLVIISNASLSWIKQCLLLLPLTSFFINRNKIEIISGKDKYVNIYPDNIDLWKLNIFKEEYDKMIHPRKYKNKIISIGDSEYEYDALVNLFDSVNNCYLISVKFMKNPTAISLIKQLRLLKSKINNILLLNRHSDLEIAIRK